MSKPDIAKAPVTSLALAASVPPMFTPEQTQMIRDTYANGASAGEFAVLMEIAKARRLNPLLRQIHFVSRPDRDKGRDVWSAQVSIDGLRSVADRTGMYDGQDEAEHEYDKEGLLTLSRVKVYRKGVSRPFVGVARWSEYVQTKRDGSPTRFWNTMAHTMLDKCAEALAMRKAFPEDTAGLYVPEEMQQMEGAVELTGQLTGATGGAHSPHGDKEDYPNPETDEHYDSIIGRLAMVRNGLDVCDSHRKAAALRAELGNKANPQGARLTRDMQMVREGNLVGFEGLKEIARRWNHCDRQLAKLEAQYLAPPAESADDANNPDGQYGDPAEYFTR